MTFHLYEVTNGYTGEGALRCYVWIGTPADAERVARPKFRAVGKGYPPAYWERLTVRQLFSADDPAFCTEVDDTGWVTG